MLPFIPGPATPAFANLIKGLHPYGINASMIAIDTPSSILADVVMTIAGLLDNRLLIRIRPNDLELFLKEFLIGDEEKLIDILSLVFKAATEIDSDAMKGTVNFRSSSHLRLQPKELDALLQEHLCLSNTIDGLSPSSAAYKIDLGAEAKAEDMCVVIAKSLTYEEAVFIDISADYRGPFDIAESAKIIETEFEKVMGLFGLVESSS
jgi:hypothetical protein